MIQTLALLAGRFSALLVAGVPAVRKNKKVRESEARFSFSCCMQEDNDGFLS